jgi:AraC family transcriptional regulator
LHRLRVQFACRQLARKGTNLAAVAAAAGFADQSHFTRVFKQFTGMTPGAFRAVLTSGISREDINSCISDKS